MLPSGKYLIDVSGEVTLVEVEDAEYFHTLPENTIFIVLRSGEAWTPAGQDIVSQGNTKFILLELVKKNLKPR